MTFGRSLSQREVHGRVNKVRHFRAHEKKQDRRIRYPGIAVGIVPIAPNIEQNGGTRTRRTKKPGGGGPRQQAFITLKRVSNHLDALPDTHRMPRRIIA